MNIIPKELRAYFWGILYAFLVLGLWNLTIRLIEISAIQTYIPSILINKDTITISGFVSHTLQLAAFFTSIRLLLPLDPIKLGIGRSIFVINLDKMNDHAVYGKCEVLKNFKDFNDEPDSAGDRTFVCYKDLSGSSDVIDELVSLGEIKPESVIVSGMGPERWPSEWSSYRRSFGCPVTTNDQAQIKPFKQGKLESIVFALMIRYGYRPECEGWSGIKSDSYAMSYASDDSYNSCNLCEYFESRCESDLEKTNVIWGIRGASKTLNIIRLKNTTHELINDVHVHIRCNTLNIVKKVSDVENMDIISTASSGAQVIVRSFPPKASRFIIIETKGKPLEKDDFKVETRLISKFGVKALRWIAALSLSITIIVAAITWGHTSVANTSQSITKTDI